MIMTRRINAEVFAELLIAGARGRDVQVSGDQANYNEIVRRFSSDLMEIITSDVSPSVMRRLVSETAAVAVKQAEQDGIKFAAQQLVVA